MTNEHKNHRFVTTYGLTDDQNSLVKKFFPTDEYELRDYTDNEETDLIAEYSDVMILNAEKLSEDGKVIICDFYNELGGCFDETVVWLGSPLPASDLVKEFKCYESFDDVKEKLKYILLEAHRERNKSVEVCKVLVKGIKILSLIRNNPGITTAEITEKTEFSVRTVQRYISSLQSAGEHIEYDRKIKGWKLTFGKSVLFGDFF